MLKREQCVLIVNMQTQNKMVPILSHEYKYSCESPLSLHVGVPESPAQAEMETKFKAMNFSSGNSRGEDLIHP